MNILCIEDIKDKFEHINDVLSKEKYNVIWKKNYQEGLMELRCNSYDILLLDMSMPICENEFTKDNFDNFAGLSILREIKRKRYNIKVIIVTGFSDFERGNNLITINELEKEILEKYELYYLGYVKYDSASVEWQERMRTLLTIKEEQKNEDINSGR